jgi:hypothetical protein
MPIEFRCGCGKILETAEEYAGKQVKCDACGRTAPIPGVQAAAAPPLVSAGPPAAPAPLAAAPWDDRPAAERVCPDCGSALSAKAVLCVNCGLILKTKRTRVRENGLSPAGEAERNPRRSSRFAQFFSDRLVNANVWGGLSIMTLAVLWFFDVLLYVHRFFFYPPILFIFGLIALLSGLSDGADV